MTSASARSANTSTGTSRTLATRKIASSTEWLERAKGTGTSNSGSGRRTARSAVQPRRTAASLAGSPGDEQPEDRERADRRGGNGEVRAGGGAGGGARRGEEGMGERALRGAERDDVGDQAAVH